MRMNSVIQVCFGPCLATKMLVPQQEENNKAGYFQGRWYNKQVGEVTEWFMVPLSKSGLRLYRSVGSNPTLSVERCWSGLTGTPGERVSGFPTVGSNPTLSANLRQGYGWQAKFTMWYVYILKSANDNNLYVGSTNDIAH
jgi:hypothetical protein